MTCFFIDDIIYIVSLLTKTKPTLTNLDRCDRCGAQAYVKVSGLNGELMFCSHHYSAIVDNAIGYDSMMKFMVSIIDERNKLENDR